MKPKNGGSSTSSTDKTKRRKKVGGGPSPIEHVKVITETGHVRWETRPREKTR